MTCRRPSLLAVSQPAPARTICVDIAQRHRWRHAGGRSARAGRARGERQRQGAQVDAHALCGVQAALEQRGAERQPRAARPQQRALGSAALRLGGAMWGVSSDTLKARGACSTHHQQHSAAARQPRLPH